MDDGAICGREPVEVVQAAELVRAGLDGVAGLVQELADIADTPADPLGPHGEQGSDGDLGQGEALVDSGGQEPVGEGEHGRRPVPGAVSLGRCPRRLSRFASHVLGWTAPKLAARPPRTGGPG
jgi:hypothetical protein